MYRYSLYTYLFQLFLEVRGDTVIGGKEDGEVLGFLEGEGIHVASVENSFSSVVDVGEWRGDPVISALITHTSRLLNVGEVYKSSRHHKVSHFKSPQM
jgi:hypothetical protein